MDVPSESLSPSPSLQDTPHGRFSNLSPKSIAVFLVVIVLFTAGVIYGMSQFGSNNTDTNKKTPEENTEKIVNIAPYTLVYGSWTESNSMVFAYDLSTGKENLIAKLPVDIKKVSVTSPNTLLYINQTDVRDHGKEITQYDISTQQQTVLFTATEGFGIDDYVISQNSKYISIWEVQVAEDSEVLLGGKSRVYTADISKPNTKNLIYDEVSTLDSPVHYPRAILNNGTVFMDKFLPNSGAGWAYGMSVSNFIGTDKKDLDNMQNGTYGTQPVLSPDGKYLVFSGYDGSRGDGATLVDGYRASLLYSNIPQILDTQTLERKDLNIPKNAKYGKPQWDSDNNILLTILSGEDVNQGAYKYNIPSESFSPVQELSPNHAFISEITPGIVLAGQQNQNVSNLGNLGDTYAAAYYQFDIVQKNTSNVDTLQTNAALMQLITTVPTHEIEIPNNSLSNSYNERTKTIQLQTFHIKPAVITKRTVQQSKTMDSNDQGDVPEYSAPGLPQKTTTPPPKKPIYGECDDIRTKYMPEKCGSPPTGGPELIEYTSCHDAAEREFYAEYSCTDSPLYLYGPGGKQIDVTIHTPIYNDSPKSQDGKYSVILGTNGSFSYLGNTHNSIEYDYTSAIKKFPRLKQGYLVSKANVKDTVKNIAKQFGFNEKETNDTVRDMSAKVTSDYAFISFYDHKTSQAILPITFDPKPDVYRNIVFYVKNLDQKPNYSIQPPTIEKIKRHGFTAIEISQIVE